jgi:hypothetical protein
MQQWFTAEVDNFAHSFLAGFTNYLFEIYCVTMRFGARRPTIAKSTSQIALACKIKKDGIGNWRNSEGRRSID